MSDSRIRRSPGGIAVRYRTRTEIIRDVLTACRHLGEIAMVAELGMQEPDLDDVSRTAEGLRRVLIERAEGQR